MSSVFVSNSFQNTIKSQRRKPEHLLFLIWNKNRKTTFHQPLNLLSLLPQIYTHTHTQNEPWKEIACITPFFPWVLYLPNHFQFVACAVCVWRNSFNQMDDSTNNRYHGRSIWRFVWKSAHKWSMNDFFCTKNISNSFLNWSVIEDFPLFLDLSPFTYTFSLRIHRINLFIIRNPQGFLSVFVWETVLGFIIIK